MSGSESIEAPTSQVRLRPMTVADLDLLLPYEEIMFGSEAWSRQSYLDELADSELRCYLVAESVAGRSGEAAAGEPEAGEPEARRSVELLGSAGLLTIGETAQILTVGVLPAARRRGIGTQLVQALVAEAIRRGADEVLLEVRIDNDAARTLYEREGFELLGVRRGYYDHGRVDALTMRLDVRAGGRRGH
ncbi:GNAT family N-acetyltransferase [Jatrophihabitans sp. DSM 45814]